MTHSNLTHRQPNRTLFRDRRARFAATLTVLIAVAALAALTAPRAGALSDAEELTRVGSFGSGAGELKWPAGVATDPVTGHFYVAESDQNHRVSEFTAWGDFVKAFGWDVAPGAVNEQQEVRVRASSGQFKLGFGAATTTALPFDAEGAEVEAALNALTTIGGVGGSVSVETVPGTPNGETPFVHVVIFKGSLAGTDVEQLTPSSGTTPPGGGIPATELEVRTRADGTAGGTGLESCTAESGCKAGLEGAGAGQLAYARGAAVDAGGNVYVREAAAGVGNNRVQKFDPAGRFLLMFGGEVNDTTKANRCTKAQLVGGDICGKGTIGNGNGQFGSNFSSAITLGAGGKVFVGDVERIQRFNPEGEWEASIPVTVPVSDPPTTVHHLAIAPGSGDFYAIVGGQGTNENVRILDPTSGVEEGKLQATELKNSVGQGISPTRATAGPVAVDPAGNVYARRNNLSLGQGEPLASPLLQFDVAGKQTSEFGRALLPDPDVGGLGVNALGTLYVSANSAASVIIFGPGPVSFEGPPNVPPSIDAQFATSVGRTDAVLAADVNPRFFTDTRYYVQYGTGKCSEGGCESQKPLAPGAILTTKALSSPVRSAGVFLEGLQPGTTYHYRFVAESTGGGPVRGVGGEVGVDGEEATFTTYPVAPLKADCPNQRFRTGFSAPLPDCRAYEMVSPIDKNNGDIKALISLIGYRTDLTQSAAGGERFTYSSYRAFADPEAGAYTMQYMASREEGVGWASEAINPPQGHDAIDGEYNAASFPNAYKAFSADLCDGWLSIQAEPALVPSASEGYRLLYRRDNCGSGGYEALIGVEPTSSTGFLPELQGVSADGAAAVFRVGDKLTEDAAAGAWQAYFSRGGELNLLCVLPNGSPAGTNCSAGTGGFAVGFEDINRLASVTNAISGNGSHVYWTDSGGQKTGPGKVYLRLNPGEEQSALSGGECAEPEKACTVRVSETESTKASRFLAASSEGSRALFEVTEGAQAGNLYLFDAQAGDSTLIAGETRGVAGTSENLSRVYFVSEEEIAATSGATAGRPNLYLSDEGTITFIATLSDADVASGNDVEAGFPANTAPEPMFHAARATADGSVLAFISTEPLTGYDNTDQASGKALSEVYRFEVGAQGPVCVSCNPGGARPNGRPVKVRISSPGLPAAAWIPPAQYTLYFSRLLSADGSRLFFNSHDGLLPRDTNGKTDVYEWEAAAGQGECEERGAELYVEASGGCLSLITSGQGSGDAEFLDAGASGDDVFFTTSSSLLPQDPGLIDVYDARVNGGLPGPPRPPAACQGEACQLAPPPPSDPTPASASFRGAGNLGPKPRGRCAKGKARRKGRCVARKGKRTKQGHGAKKQNANSKRRAGR